MISKKITNGFFKLVMGIASIFDLKIAVILDDHKIRLQTVHEDEKENTRYFDSDFFINGNLYIRGKANPVNLNEIEDETHLISSEKYQRFFNIDIIEKIANVSKGSVEIKGWTMMLLLLAVNSIILVFLFFMMAG